MKFQLLSVHFTPHQATFLSVMSINDKEIYINFLKLDFRLKGAKASQPSDYLIEEHNALLEEQKRQSDAGKVLTGVKKKLSDTRNTKPQPSIKSSTVIASRLGVSAKIVENCRYILDHASEDIKKRLMVGELSISQAVKLTKPYREYKARQGKAGGHRKKPGASMATILSDTYKEVEKTSSAFGMLQLRNAFDLLCSNLEREGWINHVEVEDIQRILKG